MKLRSLILVFLFLSTNLFAEEFQKKLNIENAINSQITGELSSLLPPRSFAVFTSADVDVTQVKELAQGETLVQRTQENSNSNLNLPGFEQNTVVPDGEKQQNERQTYRYVEKEQIRNVNVRVVFDETLSEELKTSARTLLTQRLAASYGSKATVSFQTAPLQQGQAGQQKTAGAPVQQNPSFWDFLRENLHKVIIASLLAGLIISLWKWLTLKRHTQMRPRSMYPYAPIMDMERRENLPELLGQNPDKPRDQNSPLLLEASKPSLNEVLAALIDEITKDPLIARYFLRQLDGRSKKVIMDCFATSSLKDAIQNMIGPQEEPELDLNLNAMSDDQRTDRLSAIAHDFEQFKKIIAISLNQRLGSLTLLGPQEISRLLQQLEVEEQGIVLRHLTKANAGQVVRSLSDDHKKALLAHLNYGGDLSPDLLAKVEEKISKQMEHLAKEIFLPFSNANHLVDLLIEEADDTKSLLSELVRYDPKAAQKYRSHLMSFSDLLTSRSKLSPLLKNVANETIAYAICDSTEEQRKFVLESLPNLRRSVVSSILLSVSRNRQVEQVSGAQKEILRAFRNNQQQPHTLQ